MKSMRVRCDIARSAAIVAIVSGSSWALAEVTIYGGPTYNPPTITGARNPTLPHVPGSTAGNGVGVAFSEKHIGGTNYGYRAIRWDTSGSVELGFLGTFGGSAISYAYAINADGIAVGSADKFVGGVDRGSRAVRWDPGTTIPTELGPIGSTSDGTANATAFAINASGTIVGGGEKYVGNSGQGYRAARWDAGSLIATELDNLGTANSGLTQNYAIAVNTANTAVGYGTKYTEGIERGTRAIRWDAGTTTAIELGNLGTGSNPFGGASDYTSSRANAINAQGTVVGFANKYVGGANRGKRAVRWDAGGTVATELGNLGTLANGSTSSEAYAINDTGTVVGFAEKYVSGSSRGFRAVRWDAGTTTATELGILGSFGGGFSTSYAYAINADGITVGFARKYTPSGTLDGDRAVYWGQDAEPVDLNTLLSPEDAFNWKLYEARDISDTGWITGIGFFDPDGATGPLASYSRLFLMQISASTCALCAADYNQDGGIDGSDIGAFFTDWEQGADCADTNQDGGVDGSDVGAFYAVWEAGGC